jgi:hypothetical protein
VSGTGAALRPGFIGPDARASRRAARWTVASAAILGLLVAAGPIWWRLLFALCIGLLLLTLMLTRPAAAILATFTYLLLLGFIRRVLIAPAGWTSADPLLLVAPLVAVVGVIMLFALQRRRVAPDLISKLVLFVLVVTVLEVFNPEGNGIAAGIAGLLFTVVPLLWFFVGRELVDAALVDRLLSVFLAFSIVIGLYGLAQTQLGFPSWDNDWLNTAGYASLKVGGVTRAFGTFASAQEYALAEGAGLVIAFTMVLRGRMWALLPMPLLGVALFLASGRAALILAVAGIIVVAAMKPRRPVAAILVTAIALGGAYGALKVFGGAAGSSNSLISHQVGGLTDPLNSSDSTLLLHLQIAWDGIKSSFSHPFGQGDSATNLASGVNPNSYTQTATNAAGANTKATEFDLSNAWVIMGPLGGVIYMFLALLILWRATVAYFVGRDEMLAVIGVLVVGLGQWLIGGEYALSALCWLLIGTVAAAWIATRPSTDRASPPATADPLPAGRR